MKSILETLLWPKAEFAPAWMLAATSPSAVAISVSDEDGGPMVAFCERAHVRDYSYIDSLNYADHFGDASDISERLKQLPFPVDLGGGEVVNDDDIVEFQATIGGWRNVSSAPHRGAFGLASLFNAFLPNGKGKADFIDSAVGDWTEYLAAAKADECRFVMRAAVEAPDFFPTLHLDKDRLNAIQYLTAGPTTRHAKPGSWTRRDLNCDPFDQTPMFKPSWRQKRQMGQTPTRSFAAWRGTAAKRPSAHCAQGSGGRLKLICIGCVA